MKRACLQRGRDQTVTERAAGTMLMQRTMTDYDGRGKNVVYTSITIPIKAVHITRI